MIPAPSILRRLTIQAYGLARTRMVPHGLIRPPTPINALQIKLQAQGDSLDKPRLRSRALASQRLPRRLRLNIRARAASSTRHQMDAKGCFIHAQKVKRQVCRGTTSVHTTSTGTAGLWVTAVNLSPLQHPRVAPATARRSDNAPNLLRSHVWTLHSNFHTLIQRDDEARCRCNLTASPTDHYLRWEVQVSSGDRTSTRSRRCRHFIVLQLRSCTTRQATLNMSRSNSYQLRRQNVFCSSCSSRPGSSSTPGICSSGRASCMMLTTSVRTLPRCFGKRLCLQHRT